MKVISLVVSVILIIVSGWCFTATAAGKDEPRTGRDLSRLTLYAIKKIPTTDLVSGAEIPEADRINTDRVIEVYNMSSFCESKGVSPTDCHKFGMAFTIGQQYPIYINADPKMGSEYRTFIGWINSSMNEQIKYIIAAVLYHESFHARGEKREAPAYTEELALLKKFKDDGSLNNASWTAIFITDCEKNIAIAEKYDVGAEKIKIN